MRLLWPKAGAALLSRVRTGTAQSTLSPGALGTHDTVGGQRADQELQ